MDNNITVQFCIENEEYCMDKMKDEFFYNTIPLLNANELHEFRDNSLVRFHGMIQDMFNPEYYYKEYEIENEITQVKCIKYGKYRDTTDLSENETINYNSSRNVTGERNTLVVISLPGLNDWVHKIEKEQHGIKKLNNDPKNKVGKRSMEDDEELMEVEMNKNPVNKKICTTETSNASSSTGIVSRDYILNFPLSDKNGKCCLVKVYDEGSNDLKINDMIEVVGFLSVNPMLTGSNEDDNDMEVQTHNPPTSLVPRIHCLSYKRLQHYNPLTKTIPLNSEEISSVRNEMRTVLTQLLFGDQLAADYLIFHLISRVYLRNESLALGKFSLNFTNIPVRHYPSYGEQLYEFLKLLLPKSHYLPMSLDNMNSLAFSPKKDYDSNRLTSGVLQLSNNTHLILDETKLQQGRLDAAGCAAVAALAMTIRKQKVEYDFKFYQMQFDCDIPVLILSEGESLLPKDVYLPLVPDEHCLSTFTEIVEAAKHFLNPELLNKIRVYLTRTRHATYELSENATKLVENDFVRLRRNEQITGDDLHELLVLARFICLSKGKNTLDEECWKEACEMEAERKKRLVNKPQRKLN